ncbi:MAG: recombinase family protein [Candidatus Daviesbacteria bacterium]|nr:recombinase family protein [Candidatus Daviesbacteria bacterium]
MKNKNEKKTAVGYVRTAAIVEDSESDSIEVQEKRIKEYCRKNDVDLNAVYFDPAKSGIKLDRPGFNALLSLVRSGKVKSVICTSPDRISRQAKDSLTVRVLLKKYGADLFFTDTNILDEEPYSGMFDEILKTVKTYDQIISERVRRGKKGK